MSKLIKDYLSEAKSLESFSNGVPSVDNFKAQAKRLDQCFTPERRSSLVRALRRQNEPLTALEEENILAIEQGAKTVTTGHQLMVAGGSAFFEIKILNTVSLAKQLSESLGEPVVPVFWMATEDHDFEEISTIRIAGEVFTWKFPSAKGPVGRLPVEDLAVQLDQWAGTISLNAAQKDLINKRITAYRTSATLAEATRKIVRQWTSEYGLLVIDGDDTVLKESVYPVLKRELNGEYAKLIRQQTKFLEGSGFKAQVFPREINLFSLEGGQRLRIVDPTQAPSNALELSPNALLRPLYQEWVLPNLAYIGGGGELAYWLQLALVFEHLAIPMPLLYVRYSVLPTNGKIEKKLDRQQMRWQEVLSVAQEEMTKSKLGYYDEMQQQSAELAKPLHDAVHAWGEQLTKDFPELYQHSEALKAKMQNLTGRTIETRYRALKRRKLDIVQDIERIYEHTFPGGSFWERKRSYLDLIGWMGHDPKEAILDNMSTIKSGILVLFSEK